MIERHESKILPKQYALRVPNGNHGYAAIHESFGKDQVELETTDFDIRVMNSVCEPVEKK